MRGMLRVRCRHCRTSFVSAHRGRGEQFRADPDLELRERCPHCGTDGVYRVADYVHGRLVGPCGRLDAGHVVDLPGAVPD